MKVRSIIGFMTKIPMEQFVNIERAKTPMGLLLIALVAETTWSSEYEVCGYWAETPHLEIQHSVFLQDQPLVITEDSGIVTVDGVEKAVLAHIGAQLKMLQEQSVALQLKSAALSDASGNIYRAEAQAAVVAQFPEAVECLMFAPYGKSDLTCFILGHTIFVARGTCPEFSGGIVKIDMPCGEWHYMKSAQKYERFWAELARVFVAQELKVPKDDLYWQKTFVIKDFYLFHANEVQLRRRSVNEKIIVTFDVDSLPAKVVQVPDNENAEV